MSEEKKTLLIQAFVIFQMYSVLSLEAFQHRVCTSYSQMKSKYGCWVINFVVVVVIVIVITITPFTPTYNNKSTYPLPVKPKQLFLLEYTKRITKQNKKYFVERRVSIS